MFFVSWASQDLLHNYMYQTYRLLSDNFKISGNWPFPVCEIIKCTRATPVIYNSLDKLPCTFLVYFTRKVLSTLIIHKSKLCHPLQTNYPWNMKYGITSSRNTRQEKNLKMSPRSLGTYGMAFCTILRQFYRLKRQTD